MHQEPIRVRARDGVDLAGDLFLPDGAPRGAVLVAPAMGVPRGYYAAFAGYLARSGLATLTLDYRGIGGSRSGPLRECPATLHDWGELDLAGGVDLLAARFSRAPLLWFGHSVGGQLFGLAAGPEVRGALLVGAQSGHWRVWPGAARRGIAVLWYAAIPLLVPAFGRLPAVVLGGGEDVPPGVAREWAEWGRAREYVLSYARPRGGLGFAHWAGALRSYAIEDDRFAPLPTVRELLRFFDRAIGELRILRPQDLGVRQLGHFGLFRRRFEESAVWAEMAEWLIAAAEGRAGAASSSAPK